MLRKLVLIIAALFALVAMGAATLLFFFGNQLLLAQLRKEAANFAPLKIEIGDLHTQILGPLVFTISNLEVTSDGKVVKIREAKLSAGGNLLALYFAYSSKQAISLSLNLTGLNINLPLPGPAAALYKNENLQAPAAWPKSFSLPPIPIPLKAEIQVASGEMNGRYIAKDLSGNLNLNANATGAEITGSAKFLAGAAGSEALIPVTAEWKLAGTPQAWRLQSFAFKAAGLEGNASGELDLQPVKGKGKLTVETPDLARLSLRAEDLTALGLAQQPSGSFSLRAEAEADAQGKLTLDGQFRMGDSKLMLQSQHSLWSGFGISVEGPVNLKADIPFHAQLMWPYGSNPPKLTTEKASFAIDLTAAAVAKKEMLVKPKGIPLKAELFAASGASGIKVDSFSLSFHTLQLKGNGELPYPLGQSIDGSFVLDLKSLAGFPALLPVLAENKSASLTDAQGSIQAEGRLHALPAYPGKSLVDLKSLAIRNLRLPLAFANNTMAIKGILTGNTTAQGKYDAGDLNVSHSIGSFDLTGLDLLLKETAKGREQPQTKFEKKRGRKLILAFDAKGSPSRLDIRKISITADGLAASVSGSAAFSPKRTALLQLSASAHAELDSLREYLPKLPIKISGGAFDGQLKIGGTWLPEGGIEKSPLMISGKLNARIGSVILPEAPATASPAPIASSPAPILPDWPAARNAELAYRIDLAQVQRGTLETSGISANGSLKQGKFAASLTLAKTFGGKAGLLGLTGSLLDPNLALSGRVSANAIDLSRAAAFVDPAYGKIVKGSLDADATFQLPSLWSANMLETITCNGQAQIHNGYLSTATFDGLVNERLKAIPGIGDKAKVTTGGMAAEIRAQFQYARSVATLQNLVAVTPKKDELRLQGTLGLNFDCDLKGEAHLTSAPVSGPIREANSDPEGRLVVPVRFHGNLKSPQAEIATEAIETMLKKTALHEGEKLKARAIDTAKTKAKDALQNAAGGLLDQFKKSFSK